MTAEVQEITTRGTDPETGRVITHEISVWRYGPLAVHLSWEADAWCVTHVASGYSVCRLTDYDGAHEIAAGMAGFDWAIPNPNNPPGPLRVEVTIYLREARKKYPDLTAVAIDLEPATL